jgi:zinc transport system substrate-binding protein
LIVRFKQGIFYNITEKSMKNYIRQMLLIPAILAMTAGMAAAKVEVMVSVAPQKWLVETIGGGHVESRVLVPPGRDPHTFEPSPRQVAALSGAAIWFTMDMEFEHHLEDKVRGIAPNLAIVNSTAGIARREMGEDHGHAHGHDEDHKDHGDEHEQHDGHDDHGDGHDADHGDDHGHGDVHDDHGEEHHGEHDTAGSDPHVWLSPENLRLMAENITRSLIEVDQGNAGEYEANLAELTAELTAADKEIADRLAPYRGKSFYVYHPTFGYFADRYDLVQEPVEVEGKSPSPRQLSKLIARAKEEKVNVIFVQPQFDQQSIAVISQAIGGNVVPLDALAEDVVENIKTISVKLEEAFKLQRGDS